MAKDKKSQARRKKRISIMGKKGAKAQDTRASRGLFRASFTYDRTKFKTKDAIRRVGEYKKATAEADAHSKEGKKRYKKKKTKVRPTILSRVYDAYTKKGKK